ncbi:fumarylacetoacetate hydrolase family protein [Streptosporangium algeriense]|uniref:Fumarylacetoacetate hydrolase family protein n=1 Tax=Streptosporangium algeriense TaxID=1682748 RepID=A0ABW3DKP2_9ACTN
MKSRGEQAFRCERAGTSACRGPGALGAGGVGHLPGRRSRIPGRAHPPPCRPDPRGAWTTSGLRGRTRGRHRTRGSRIPAETVMNHIAGYMVSSDVPARDVAFGQGLEHPLLFQIARSKSSATFCPTGPWLVTPDEFDPSDARLRLWANGELRQDSTTAGMVVDVAGLISSVSASIALRPGDILLTGTPPGRGCQLDPPSYLTDGDIVEATTDGLGHMRTRVVAEPVTHDATVAAV